MESSIAPFHSHKDRTPTELFYRPRALVKPIIPELLASIVLTHTDDRVTEQPHFTNKRG